VGSGFKAITIAYKHITMTVSNCQVIWGFWGVIFYVSQMQVVKESKT